MGRLLIGIGIVLIVIGSMVILKIKIPFVGHLPGDIIIKKENFSFYFPFTTCVILSLILTVVLFFLGRK